MGKEPRSDPNKAWRDNLSNKQAKLNMYKKKVDEKDENNEDTNSV